MIFNLCIGVPISCLLIAFTCPFSNKVSLNRFFREGSFTTLVLTHLEAVVGPRSKLEVAALVIKWEPGDVNFARGLEDARRHIEHGALRRGHNVCLESPIKPLVGTE